MGRSLGMAAYRALSRRTAERGFTPSGQRPPGTLLWINAAEPANWLAVTDLAQRIAAARYDLKVLITLPDRKSHDTVVSNWLPHDRIQLDLLPSEHPEAVNAFWANWTPDMALWVHGDLRPNLLQRVHEAGCPIALIDADVSGFDSRRDRWLPDLSRQLLEPFREMMVRTDETRRRLEQLGLDPRRISVTPPLQAGGQVLPCRESDIKDLSRLLGGRPVWFASNIQKEELASVLSAHRQATRLSHRLLLILHPASPELVETSLEHVSEEGLRLADWSANEDPDDTTQVLLARDAADIGLFYRVAPVTFMGSSLIQGYSGRNPFEAAALGSAVLYGPNVPRYMPFYSRLAKAGAARIVKDAETLGAAVSRLIAPDQAAAMAHSGWEVVSQGADLIDRVIELVHATLDGDGEVRDARS